MLGLGSSVSKSGKAGPTIVRDGLVLKHDYSAGGNQPVSTGAAYFDGTDDYITIGDVFDLGTNDFTISFWCKASDLTSFRAVNKFQDDNNQIFLGFANDDKVYFLVKGGGNVVSSGKSDTACTALENTWIHVCATAGANRSDGTGTGVIYVNGTTSTYGKAAFNLSNDDQDLDSTGSWEIGRRQESATTTYKEGYICNVGIWSTALTQAQVKSIMHKDYASLSDSEKTDLVSWWNLDTAYDSFVFDNHHGGGDTLGAELITNGDFSNGATGWIEHPADAASVSFGENGVTIVQSTDLDTQNRVYQLDVTEALKSYKVTYTIHSALYSDVNNTLKYYTGDAYVDLPGQGVGTHTFYYTRQTGNANWYFNLNINTDSVTDYVTISDISVKLVNGNTGTLS